MKVIVVGAGAAGMACAITAADHGHQVTILERMDRVGKKILATGNGRCNLMNVEEPRYPRGDRFAGTVLSQCGAEEQKAFWHALGLRMRQEDGGRVYPASGQASTVLDTLRLALESRNVNICTGMTVNAVQRKKGVFTVSTAEGETFHADRVVIAGGGKAQPKLGSDGSAITLLGTLGHTIHPCTPALTALNCDQKILAGLAGIRVKAVVDVLQKGQLVHQEAGEVLFTESGLSGVCIMNCSGYISHLPCEVRLNLLPSLGLQNKDDALAEILTRRKVFASQPMERLMTGLCVPRLASALCKQAGLRWKERYCGDMSRGEATALAETITAFHVPVVSMRGFEQAQVTRGGAACEEFDPQTMQSRLVPGLYAIGEVLDVDGECGGYNLLFAFGSGIIAGKHLED